MQFGVEARSDVLIDGAWLIRTYLAQRCSEVPIKAQPSTHSHVRHPLVEVAWAKEGASGIQVGGAPRRPVGV